MRIKKGKKWKLVFQTQYSYFKYQVIPFGLFNALTSFQDYISKILAEKFDIFVIVYSDNIFIYTKDLGQPYVNAIWGVLKELRKNVFFAKLKKCYF